MNLMNLRYKRIKGKDNRKIEKYSLYSERMPERDMYIPKIIRVPMVHFDLSRVINQRYFNPLTYTNYSLYINPYWRGESTVYYYDDESMEFVEADSTGRKRLPKQRVYCAKDWNPRKSEPRDAKNILRLLQELKPTPKNKTFRVTLKSWIYYQIESVPIRCMKMLLFLRIVVQRPDRGSGSIGNITFIAVAHRYKPNFWDIYSQKHYVGGVYRNSYNYWCISTSQRTSKMYFFCHQDAILELVEEYLGL